MYGILKCHIKWVSDLMGLRTTDVGQGWPVGLCLQSNRELLKGISRGETYMLGHSLLIE